MAVIVDGIEATRLVDYDAPELLAVGEEKAPAPLLTVALSASMCPSTTAERTGGLFDPAYYEDLMLRPFREGTIAEAPVLAELERRGVAIDGIAIRDKPEDVAAFLQRNGDPYQRIGADLQSSVQVALGSSGVPESFVVDGRGVIRYQHVGAIMPQDVATVLAEVEKAR